jgi:hypothetical protein
MSTIDIWLPYSADFEGLETALNKWADTSNLTKAKQSGDPVPVIEIPFLYAYNGGVLRGTLSSFSFSADTSCGPCVVLCLDKQWIKVIPKRR